MCRSLRSLPRLITWSCCVALGVSLAQAADAPKAGLPQPAAWDRFRGPNGSGVAENIKLPDTWTDADYRWTVDLPGQGLSSPVVWGDRLYIASADETKLERYVLCYSTRDGKLIWQNASPFPKEKKHLQNSYATNTPAVDAKRVYHLWQSKTDSQLLAFDHDGKLLWTSPLGAYKSGHGGGISPVVVDDVVAINYLQEGESRLIGVDAATGSIRWSVPRKSVKASYSTPCVFEAGGSKQLIFTSWSHGVTSVDPATGAVLWELDTFDATDGEAKRSIGSPLTQGGVIYGNCAFVNGKKFMVALKPDAANPTSSPAELFKLDRTVNHMPTAVAYAGLLFCWTDAGIVLCVDGITGETVWQKRIGGNFSGSPIVAGGKLYAMSEDGETIVLAASREYAELGRVPMSEGSRSTPAVADGTMYLRTFTKLHALAGK